jgi:membrane protein implicated in regulation of membrane protease activity
VVHKSETAPQRAWKDTKNWVLSSFIAWLLASIITLGSGALAAIFIPTNASLVRQSIYGAIGGLVALVLFLIISYLTFLLVAPYRQRNEARSELAKIEGGGDEVSRVIKQLSELQMHGKEGNEDYTSILMRCADALAIGNITLEIGGEYPTYTNFTTGETTTWTCKGMTHRQLQEFLGRLRLEGIVKIEHRTITESAGYSYHFDDFYITELGRQVVERIKQTQASK